MIIHVVLSGETLFSIANEYGVSPQRLRTDNGLTPTQQLVPGQALLILFPNQVYTVASGDTLRSIAERYGITVRQLLQNNPSLSLDTTLYPGQTVVIAYDSEKRGSILTNGYVYPFVQPQELRRTLPYLSLITPFTYGITESGALIPLNDAEILRQATEAGTGAVMLVSTLGEDDLFNSELPGCIFANETATASLVQNIVNTAQSGGYRYIDIDFEFLPAEEAQNYAAFIGRLRQAANAEGIGVIVALAPKTSANMPGLLYEGHLYPELGQNADYVLLMTYEWGYTFGPPQAVAPINKVREVIDYAVSVIPPEKILLGVPNYGYDWKLPFVSGQSRATSLANVDAVLLAEQYNQDIQFDTTAMTPYFYYTDNEGNRHVVWFEDARSVLQKLNLISEYNLAGFSVWNVMRWFPALWLTAANLYEIEE